MIRKSHKLLERYINSRIIYNMLDDEAWTEYLNQDDPGVMKALDVFKRKAAFPKKKSKNMQTSMVGMDALPMMNTGKKWVACFG